MPCARRYIVAQLLGGIAGAAMLKGVYHPDVLAEVNYGAHKLGPLVRSIVLLFVVFFVTIIACRSP